MPRSKEDDTLVDTGLNPSRGSRRWSDGALGTGNLMTLAGPPAVALRQARSRAASSASGAADDTQKLKLLSFVTGQTVKANPGAKKATTFKAAAGFELCQHKPAVLTAGSPSAPEVLRQRFATVDATLSSRTANSLIRTTSCTPSPSPPPSKGFTHAEPMMQLPDPGARWPQTSKATGQLDLDLEVMGKAESAAVKPEQSFGDLRHMLPPPSYPCARARPSSDMPLIPSSTAPVCGVNYKYLARQLSEDGPGSTEPATSSTATQAHAPHAKLYLTPRPPTQQQQQQQQTTQVVCFPVNAAAVGSAVAAARYERHTWPSCIAGPCSDMSGCSSGRLGDLAGYCGAAMALAGKQPQPQQRLPGTTNGVEDDDGDDVGYGEEDVAPGRSARLAELHQLSVHSMSLKALSASK
eukprot:CAMPEP_0202894526 /NCGR_PEP_ID=MMETSP1392-20130828/3917_1 /ASSEMBLY_ACC=CAM_ASM_000868 /TAXON_ID=225041 /ORGANISM="Chlamydomonas chlamydogama, Strain SAG 11-48b" /LENGTH=408 /DNA_ID=CAMNT_0049579255 /DNA_START=176 /DNA_END=1402 /DNA_ORIENTATION=-